MRVGRIGCLEGSGASIRGGARRGLPRRVGSPIGTRCTGVAGLAALAFLTLAMLRPPAAWAEPAAALYIQPLGTTLPDADVALVKHALVLFYGLDVRVLPRVEPPKAAWYAPRKRWRAEVLLDFLAPRLPADGYRILGLTAADISTTKGNVKDWGILGLATIDGTACVVSAFRTHKGVSRDAARVRLAKVVVHEIGHTLGLGHCPRMGCLMADAEGYVATVDHEADLCDDCRRRLVMWGRPVQAIKELPWPPPRERAFAPAPRAPAGQDGPRAP